MTLSPRQINSHISRSKRCLEVLQLVCTHWEVFDAIHTSTALHKTAQLMQHSDKQLIAQHPGYGILLTLTAAKASAFQPWALSNILWALSQLPQDHQHLDGLPETLTAGVSQQLPKFNSQQLANSLWAMAHMGHNPGPRLLSAVATQATQLYDSMQVLGHLNDLAGTSLDPFIISTS